MGACLSCLGVAGPESASDPSEAHHLLNEPYPPNHYGTTGPDNRNSPQVDPEEIRKQRDALERLCAATSDKLIDVTQTTRSDEGRVAPTKMVTDYPRLFSEQFGGVLAREETNDGRPDSETTLTDEDEGTYLRKLMKGKDLENWNTPEGLGSLSVQFDDLLGPGPVAANTKARMQH